MKSISNQTFTEFEALIWDDGSTDGTWDELQRASDRLGDPRIKVYQHEDNIGLTKGLNDALTRTEAEYVAIVGSGDTCDPTRLAKQVRALDAEPQAVFCATRSVTTDAITGEVFSDETFDKSTIVRTDITESCPFTHGSVMYRRSALEAIGGYEEVFTWCADWDVFFRLLDISSAVYLSETLYSRVAQADGVSFSPTKAFDQICFKYLALELSSLNGGDRRAMLDTVATEGVYRALEPAHLEIARDLARRNVKLFLMGRREAGREMRVAVSERDVTYGLRYRLLLPVASLLSRLPINADRLIRLARSLPR